MNTNVEHGHTIEHLVLSGGAYFGYYHIGALHFLEKHLFIQRENLKTIYGTSIGALVGCLMCLKLDWDTIIDYIVKRPWNKILDINVDTFMDMFQVKGIYKKDVFIKILEPLLSSCDLQINSTLEDLYTYSNIELHIFSVNIIEYTLKNISYTSHPTMPIIDAIYMSCCLPYIFEPFEFLDTDERNTNKKVKHVCVDGGLLSSYPIKICIDEQETFTTHNETVLGITFDRIYNVGDSKDYCAKYETNVHNIFDFGYFLNKQMIHKIMCLENEIEYLKSKLSMEKDTNNVNICNKYSLKYELRIPCDSIHFQEGMNVFLNEGTRQKYIDDGEKYAYVFYNSVQ